MLLARFSFSLKGTRHEQCSCGHKPGNWYRKSAIEHRGKGIIKQAKGSVKEAWGDLTDNPKTEIEGKVERVEGRVQEGFGNAIDPNRRRRK